MKRLAFALGILTVSFCVAPPALADFAVIRFNSSFCRIWTDTASGPLCGIPSASPSVRPLPYPGAS
jgi:hypothetical protein